MLSWPSAGDYEMDVVALPPPQLLFDDLLRRWFARFFFADIAYAQSYDQTPVLLGTIRFTIG